MVYLNPGINETIYTKEQVGTLGDIDEPNFFPEWKGRWPTPSFSQHGRVGTGHDHLNWHLRRWVSTIGRWKLAGVGLRPLLACDNGQLIWPKGQNSRWEIKNTQWLPRLLALDARLQKTGILKSETRPFSVHFPLFCFGSRHCPACSGMTGSSYHSQVTFVF